MLTTFSVAEALSAGAKGLGLGVILAVVAALPGHAATMTGTLKLRCTNPVGGANWSIVVDLDHRLVDTQPADISETWISWRDQHGGVYELERATGKLQLRAASTTGGYFLHYSCASE